MRWRKKFKPGRAMVFGVLLIAVMSSKVAFAQQVKEWIAPAEANGLKNPYKGDASVLADGKKIFTSMCVVCHGETGKGNGAASVALHPHPANFLSIKVENESDGAIFWKLTNGNPPMASYKTLLTEEQRWKVINYIRQLEENDLAHAKKK